MCGKVEWSAIKGSTLDGDHYWSSNLGFPNKQHHLSLSTLQHIVTHQNPLQRPPTPFIPWLYTLILLRPYCNTLHHTITHCNTMQHPLYRDCIETVSNQPYRYSKELCNTLQHHATHPTHHGSHVSYAWCCIFRLRMCLSVSACACVCVRVRVCACACVCMCACVRVSACACECPVCALPGQYHSKYRALREMVS